MDKNTKIAIFEGKRIRRHWNEKNNKWWFSVIDIVAILSSSIDPGAYWRKLKERLKTKGSESVTKCHGFKMIAADGKMRLTDMADTETMLRIIQSIPSPNAEPFKLWLARVCCDVLVIPTKVGIQSIVYMDPRVKPEDDNDVCLKRIMFMS